MKTEKKKDIGELRLKADEFDEIMRRALGVRHPISSTTRLT